MVENWFLVPKDFDEKTFLYVATENYLRKMNVEQYGKLDTTTIFTTTACNARCSYCFESNVKTKKHMSEDIAIDAAKYIESHMGDHIYLKWFGGEPLINPKVMNIICNYLAEKGLSYHSSMISNGYLLNEFDEHTIRDIWKLQNIQITLDGLKDTYNSIKSYKNGDINAFDRVINNIEYLSNMGIVIQIRINLSLENANEVESLISFLEKRFINSKRLGIYVSPLLEGCGQPPHTPSTKEREEIYKKYLELEKHIVNGPLSHRYYIPALRHNQCMADSGHSSCILPDGRLSLCEHHFEDETFGTIWDDNYDMTVFDRWAEREDQKESCKNCFYYPQCFRLKQCGAKMPCTDGLLEFYKFGLKQHALRAYGNIGSRVNNAPVLDCKIHTLT